MAEQGKHKAIVANGVKKKPGNTRAVVAALAVVLIVVIAASGWLYEHNKHASSGVCETGTGLSLLLRASDDLYPAKLNDLRPTAKQIQTLPGYDKDPNCLVVVTTFYAYNTDGKNSQLYLNKLTAVYNPKVGYSKALGGHAKTPAQLKPIVAFAQKADAVMQSNLKQFQ